MSVSIEEKQIAKEIMVAIIGRLSATALLLEEFPQGKLEVVWNRVLKMLSESPEATSG